MTEEPTINVIRYLESEIEYKESEIMKLNLELLDVAASPETKKNVENMLSPLRRILKRLHQELRILYQQQYQTA